MNAPVTRPQPAAFVAAVRAELDDLSPEEVDELTEGLEADLHDALAESGADPRDQFGDPAAYAAELRSAAGLPPRAAGGERRGAAEQARNLVADAVATVRRQPWWPGARDFAVTLRPAWWVLRALVAATGVAVFLGGGSLLLSLVLVVVSVELGRRRVADRSRVWGTVILAGNLVAVLGLWLAAARALDEPARLVVGGLGSSRVEVLTQPPSDGVWVDGVEVRNIFPYDSDGRPLAGVQLYDQDGRPVAVGESARTPVGDDQGRVIGQLPAVDSAGEQRWNAYPLRQRVESGYDATGGPVPPGAPYPPSPPRVSPAPLLVPSPASPVPSQAASASPTAPVPQVSASPTAPGAAAPTSPTGAAAPTSPAGTAVPTSPAGTAAPAGSDAG